MRGSTEGATVWLQVGEARAGKPGGEPRSRDSGERPEAGHERARC
jgi:hypothetical protein